MDTILLNMAIATTAFHSFVLSCGFFVFLRVRKKVAFSSHWSRTGICLLSLYYFIPTILFLSIVGSWICVAYDIFIGVALFLILPGVLLFLIVVAWCIVVFRKTDTTSGALELDNMWGNEVPLPQQTIDLLVEQKSRLVYPLPYFPSPYEESV